MIWLMTLGYVAVAGMLLTVSLPSRFATLIKLAGIFVVTGFYFATYFGHRELSGWPIDQELPEKFRLVWVAIDEPEKKDGVDGEIFFWIRELNENNEAVTKPRAYILPFDLALAERVQEAQEKIQEGETVNGYVQESSDEEEDEADGESKAGDSSTSGFSETLLNIEFREIEIPALPNKTVPVSS
ncbi:MAG: hypothetical protein CBE21_02915 [Proteobacteria bacterium TMED261]|nr:MAG: hypothetical protein CBE21_02915 [Proteobacteria bacterium TMED261]